MTSERLIAHSNLRYKVFFLSLVSSFIVGAVVSNAIYSKKFPSLLLQQDLEFINQFPKNFFDKSVTSPVAAKHRGLFWVSNLGSWGGASDILQLPDAFEVFFPGYLEAVTDKELWRRYFSKEFDVGVWGSFTSPLNQRSFAVIISHSWPGCFEIFKKYGADVLILGSSETFRNVIPQLIAETLQQVVAPKSKIKVLSCETSGMLMDTVRTTIDNLMIDNPLAKTKLIIWGYSFWNAYLRSKAFTTIHESKTKMLSESSYLSVRLSNFFEKIKWTDWILFNVFLHADRKNDSYEGTLQVPIEKSNDSRLLESMASKMKPYYINLEGISEEDCNFTSAKSELIKTVQSTLKLSEKLFIYIPPTTPLHFKHGPECFLSGVQKMLQNVANDRVFVETGKWEAYGLDYRHYLAPIPNSKLLYLDINHTNFEGAQIVSARVSQKIKEFYSKVATYLN